MSGKHFQLIVPNYDQTGPNATGSPLTYFRMGAAVNEADNGETLRVKTKRGDDLVDNREAAAPTDPRLRFKDDWRSPGKAGKTYFKDDGTDGDAPGRSTDGSAALTGIGLSQELISRGGWREHIDGNRISTTRGDCVEVIGGNYKLIVMGRAANTWDPAGLGSAGGSTNVGRTRQEIASGGHYNESTSTPGEVVSIVWSTTNEDGTWTTVEQTDHGNVKSIVKGFVEDYYFGPFVKSYVGKATDAISIEALKDTGEGTTAGAHGKDKPDVTEITFARSKKEQEHYVELIDHTDINGTGKHETKLHVKSKAIGKAVYNTVLDRKRACFYKESLYASNHTSHDGFSGWRRNYTLAGATLDLSFVGFTMTKKHSTRIGFSWTLNGSLSFGIDLELNIGTFGAIRIGTVHEMTLGWGTTIELLKIEGWLNALVTRLFYNETKVIEFQSMVSDKSLCGVKAEG
jgi:hypothetical protein